MQTHSLASISRHAGCYALLSEESQIAVVFVHGFLGDSRKTWYKFQSLVDELQDRYPLWGKCDLFFYSYPSRGQIIPLSEAFQAFLYELFHEMPDGTVPCPPYPRSVKLPSGATLNAPFSRRTETYQQLVLVGHSTGALIIRQAVLQEFRPFLQTARTEKEETTRGNNFLLNANLRLFGPAHRGAMCSGKMGALFSLPISGWLVSLILRSNSLFMNLQPGSPVIEDLRRETEKLQELFPDRKALRACSLFGSLDTVVYIGKYRHDIDHSTEPNQTHVSICKPDKDYSVPLEFVIDGIGRRAKSF